jgi:hypothetical protein
MIVYILRRFRMSDGKPTVGDIVEKHTTELIAGDFVILWRTEKKVVGEILGRIDGRTHYRVIGEEGEFTALMDPEQVIKAYPTEMLAEDAITE